MLKGGLGYDFGCNGKIFVVQYRYFKDPKDKVKNNIIDVLFRIHFYQFTPGWVSFWVVRFNSILREKFMCSCGESNTQSSSESIRGCPM